MAKYSAAKAKYSAAKAMYCSVSFCEGRAMLSSAQHGNGKVKVVMNNATAYM